MTDLHVVTAPDGAATTTGEQLRLRWVVQVIEQRCAMTDTREAQQRTLDAYEAALTAKRAADAELRVMAERVADALGDAEWAAADSFDTEGNKTFVTYQGKRIAVTAPEKKEWLARLAQEHGAVRDAKAGYAKAEEAVAAARDGVALAERRIAAAKYDLQAATQMLTALTTAFHQGGTR